MSVYYYNATDLETKDNGPDQTEVQTGIPIDDVMGSHILQMHALFPKELQRFVNILKAVNTHLAFRWARLGKKNEINKLK